MRSGQARNSRPRRSGRNNSSTHRQPPSIPGNVAITRTYRFAASSSVNTGITKDDLLGICGAVCTTANSTLSLLSDSVRVHKVSVWTPAGTAATATCSIEWLSDTFKSIHQVSDTSMSSVNPAHVESRPPRGSSAWHWLSTGGDAVFNLVCDDNSIVDVHCTHYLEDDGAAGNTYSVAAGTLGALYYLPLDGDSDVLVPVSLNTTT
jgi:hypothetical protein